jgi:hypothetical protein
MKIEILTTFLDGKDEYIKDEVRIVSDEAGARFVANGWAKDEAGRVAVAASGETALDIQNTSMAQVVTHG